jgi:hypothetical protein
MLTVKCYFENIYAQDLRKDHKTFENGLKPKQTVHHESVIVKNLRQNAYNPAL